MIGFPGLDCGDLRVSGATQLDADIVIVGSGAGGSTVAATAVELGHSVIILEEGPYVPPDRVPSRLTSAFKRMWRNGGMTVAFGSPPVSYAEGRCVGGSTEINSAIFQRAPADILAEWEKNYRIDKFNESDLAPFYDWAAATVNASLSPEPPGPPTEILARVGNVMGWQTKKLERGQRACVGTNMCASGCPTGGKSSMASTILPKLIRGGSRVISDTKVTAIKFKNSKATHVEAIAKDIEGREQKLRVYGRHIFICAGAIGTPALLHRSGFGGVIGKKLRLHPTLRCLTMFDEILDASKHRLPLVAITEFMPELRFGGSVLTPGTYGLALAENWDSRSVYAKNMRNAAVYYAMIRGEGHGKVISVPGKLDPIVTYRLTPSDWSRLGFGAATLAQGLLKAGARHVMPSIGGHLGWKTLADAARDVETPLPHNLSQLMTIHLFSSCPLGEDNQLCGADSFGRIHGASNLYVADASLIPEAPGVNPQATVMALARRNTLHILEKNP